MKSARLISHFAKEKLKEMGSMSKSEKKAGLYFLLTLIAFCTNKWHHVAPDYIVFMTIFLMLCPGIGVCTFKDLNGHVCLAGLPAARLCVDRCRPA